MKSKGAASFLAAVLLVLVAWLLYPLVMLIAIKCGLLDEATWKNAGVFGDAFGALNTLFAGLALAGLGINIYLQSKQLRELEVKEERTAEQLRTQTRLSALTALLQTYQAEAETYERIAQGISGSEPINDFSRITAVQNRAGVLAKRNAIVAQIEEILVGTPTGVNDTSPKESAASQETPTK